MEPEKQTFGPKVKFTNLNYSNASCSESGTNIEEPRHPFLLAENWAPMVRRAKQPHDKQLSGAKLTRSFP